MNRDSQYGGNTSRRMDDPQRRKRRRRRRIGTVFGTIFKVLGTLLLIGIATVFQFWGQKKWVNYEI